MERRGGISREPTETSATSSSKQTERIIESAADKALEGIGAEDDASSDAETDGEGKAKVEFVTTPGVLPAGFFSFSGDDNLDGIGDEILS